MNRGTTTALVASIAGSNARCERARSGRWAVAAIILSLTTDSLSRWRVGGTTLGRAAGAVRRIGCIR